MPRSLSIRSRLVLIASAVVGLAFGSVTLGASSIQPQIDKIQRDHERGTAMTRFAETAVKSVWTQELRLDDYLFGGDVVELAGYKVAVADEAAAVEALRARAFDDPTILAALDGLVQAGDAWRTTYAAPVLAAAAVATPEARRALGARSHEHDATVTASALLLGRITAFETRLEAGRSQLEQIRSGAALAGSLIVVGGVILGLWLLNIWVARPIRKLVDTAVRVEAGDDLPFRASRDDEIGQLGSALERMRLALRGGAERANLLNRFTEVTTLAADDTEVARFNLDALRMLVAPDAAVTHVLNHSKDRAIIEASLGTIDTDVLAMYALSRCPGVMRGNIYVTSDLAEPLSARCPAFPKTSGTLVCVPLEHGELVGTTHLWWDRPGAFSPEDAATVMRLAEHTALAIGNRRLMAALKGMAATDAKTGLANPRALEEHLDALIRARVGGESIALLMLDLDHFKHLNDRHGHPAGDEALRSFAQILRSCTRPDDLVARYGGEEFVIVLPRTDAGVAHTIAERIRRQTESTVLRLGPGITDRLTVSVGIAMAPEHAVEALALLRASDEALYQAKKDGRNRTVTFGASTMAADPPATDPTPRPAKRLPAARSQARSERTRAAPDRALAG